MTRSKAKSPKRGQASDVTPDALPDYGDRYPRLLALQISGANGESRSRKTRAKLKLAAFECLNEDNDLSALTIQAVTQRAKVATGTFYLHFTGTRELLLELFGGFADVDIVPAMPRNDRDGELFTQTKVLFLQLVSSFRRRRHLFRSLFQLKGQDPDANALWLNLTIRWANELSAISRTYSKSSLPAGLGHFVGHASSAIADEILMRIYIDEIFGREFAEDPGNDDYVAEMMAFIRHRILFGEDPALTLLSERLRTGELVPTIVPDTKRSAAKGG